MSSSPYRLREGSPLAEGAVFDGRGTNFAVFSSTATRVEVCLFDRDGRTERDRITLPEHTDEVWHGYLEGVRAGTRYGLRVHGPYEPDAGLRFNPNKLLLDPYARAHAGRLQWRPEIFGYILDHDDRDLSFDKRDSAPFVPKCVVTDPDVRGVRVPFVRVPWGDTVIYETHVRGYTMGHPDVPEALRGTFAGLARPHVVERIRELGVTSVELLPIHTFIDDEYLLAKGLVNYWGYNSIGFFAADPRYFATDELVELKSMIDRFHSAGLEVILDVVYNHTAEGNELGPTLSFKGIDNPAYYRLIPDQQRYYINDTGTGNTLNTSRSRTLKLVTDSLRYWVEVIGIDGFRFDLATILAREPEGFSENHGFLESCLQDPVLSSRVKLIAEPWDCGPGGYHVGDFPPGWAEWNDSFRDTVRAFWKGDQGNAGDFARRLTGSADKFARRGRRPWASVNFITAHDGFTLEDLVSYNDKHNEDNGEDNRDGHSDNRSWNCGVEGRTDDPAILELRDRQKRNLLLTLLFSQGTPMLLAGDEHGRTQQGNNNAYGQDNNISWHDWNRAAEPRHAELTEFVRMLTRLRRELPVLHRNRFLTGDIDPQTEITDVRWLSPEGADLTSAQWDDPAMVSLAVVFDGRARTSAIPRRAEDVTVLMLFNAWHEAVTFHVPELPGPDSWLLLIDTDQPHRTEQARFTSGDQYIATGRSAVLLVLETAGPTRDHVLELEASLRKENGARSRHRPGHKKQLPPAPRRGT